MEGVKWVIYKVQAVNLFLMKESINVTSLWGAGFPPYIWNDYPRTEVKPVLLCLIYELFICVYTVDT